jgi:hypothetical protein
MPQNRHLLPVCFNGQKRPVCAGRRKWSGTAENAVAVNIDPLAELDSILHAAIFARLTLR